MHQHEECYHLPRGLCTSLLSKSKVFITTDRCLRRAINLLPDTHHHCHSERHVLIQGMAGVGKRTLALHCWRIMQPPTRVLVSEKCHLLQHTLQLQQCLRKARGGDLLLDNINNLPPRLSLELPALLAHNRGVRVIALTEKTSVPRALDNFLRINIPPLSQRPADVTPLALFLLSNRLQQQVDTHMVQYLVRRKKFVSTSELYIFLVNLCFVAARLGKHKLNRAIINDTLFFSASEQIENYVTFLAGSSNLYQLVDAYGLKGLCRLLERACISNTLTATHHNVTLAGRVLRMPTSTLFNKVRMQMPMAK